jgi:acetyl-CoA carboxylase biotin carboxyl carrier protein
MAQEQDAWFQRVADLIQVLEGSTISELELSEADTEIVIRRAPGMVMVPTLTPVVVQQGMAGMVASNSLPTIAPPTTKKGDSGVAVVTPMTGVYYPSASPTSPPFVTVGDLVHVGQVIALVEAMKIFNEVQAEVSGRVTAIVATSGEVVQKGDPLLRVEPV